MSNSFIQTIKSDEFKQLSHRYTKLLTPKHWLQFADDATAISGSESDNQILLNASPRWCNWASMIIRVDKCKSFGIRKASTCSTQFQPKLFVNGERVKPVEPGGSFKYLGRYFDYDMDINSEHKRELLRRTTEILNIIDCLPLHSRKKLMIYSRYLLSKISWDLAIADLDVTWVKIHWIIYVTIIYAVGWKYHHVGLLKYFCYLRTKQYGINLLDISTKFEQCQVTIKESLKESPNEDIRELFQITSVGSDIKYDSFQSTREVLTQTRQSKTEKITGLKSQSEIVTSVWQEALVSTRNKWFSVQKVLPKNIFNFTIRYFNNTLATKSNMQKWGKALTKICDYCPEVRTLNHVVAACKSALREGRYTWRHNSILLKLSLIIKSKVKHLYVDLPDYLSPTMITGEDLRPDMVICDNSGKWYVLELICCYVTNISKSVSRKEQKYDQLIKDLSTTRDIIFINLVISSIGTIAKESKLLIDMLEKIGLNDNEISATIRKLINMTIRSTYFIFRKGDSEWPNPDPLTF